ncbi:ras-related protein Rab-9B-like [Pseudonaja textilis]|uniref:ras-related protein Rab-9B-like n=1 Tax=Pseudonaja textilis TaxID=8673 RepID=UPI000EA9E8D5|nr:ras-related protein Rab-9B-like [Pseudonaja textilis]
MRPGDARPRSLPRSCGREPKPAAGQVLRDEPQPKACCCQSHHEREVLFLGDGGVGKSSLMNRYVAHKFDSQAFHTIGVEFLNQDLEVDGRLVTLQIWDTAGQERFKSLRTPFYRSADCCLLTFRVDDRQSFENLGHWQKEFTCYANVKDPEHCGAGQQGGQGGEAGGSRGGPGMVPGTWQLLLPGDKCQG